MLEPDTLRATVLAAPDALILTVASLGFTTISVGCAVGAVALASWMEARGIGETVDTRAVVTVGWDCGECE